jgi:hypothetical protein
MALLLLKTGTMRHLARLLLAAGIALLALLLIACDPVASMKGTVDRPSGAPVAGANVSITCSSLDGGGIAAATDAHGAFSANKIGCIDKKCDIDVAVSGEPIRHFPSGDYCASGEDTCCRAIQANLTIPETGAP